MTTTPSEIHLVLNPSRRFEAIDVNDRIRAEAGDLLSAATAGPSTARCTRPPAISTRASPGRMHHHHGRLAQFFDAWHALFPPDADYHHDQMDLRSELSEQQKEVEPRNADSHLTFIGSGMRNCVTYRNQPPAPVYFIDLDGTNGDARRERKTTIVAYDQERVVARESFRVPDLAPPDRLGQPGATRGSASSSASTSCWRASGLEKGRVDIALGASERNVGLTVNEYETLLMRHDLVEVLKDPLKFAAQRGRHMIDDPLAIPTKTLNYAKYDFPRLLNSLMEALRWDHSVLERAMAKLMAVPARRLLRSRRVSFLAAHDDASGRPLLVRGTYQSPILVQWQPAETQSRSVEIAVVGLS